MSKRLAIRNILLLTVGALTLVIAILVLHEVYGEWQRLEKIESLKDAMNLSDQLFNATENLSVERDIAATMLYAPDAATVNDLKPRLEESRKRTDGAMSAAMQMLKTYAFPELAGLQEKIGKQRTDIQDFRVQIDQAVASPQERHDALAKRWSDQATGLIQQTQDLWIGFVKHFTDIDPVVTQHLRFKHFLGIITDYTGRERALISRLLVENADPTPDEVAQLLRGEGTIDLSWKVSLILADHSGLYPAIASSYADAKSHYSTLHDMMRDLFYVPGARHGVAYPIGADLWLELSTQATESLDALKEVSLRETQRYIDQLEAQARRAILVHSLLLLFALLLCLYSFWIIIYRVIHPINAMVEALLDAAEGKPVPPTLPAGRQDEIGKLAQVLHAFQKNAQEIKHTAVMLGIHTKALERSNKELDDFAYIASHDLKEPLRGIHNHSNFLLEDNRDRLDEESIRKLNRLVYLSQRMERLVNDLLYFSRLGRQDLAIQPTDMNEVIHDIESTLDIFLAERKASIVIPNPLPTVVCDKPRVTELLRNLITNAIKYNDKPEKVVEIGFLDKYISPKGMASQHVFYVKDNGRGIAPEFHEEIFRIFRRLQSSADSEDGTGVGLTFVKKIVERHGGKIWIESEPNEGTVFYFTLEGPQDDTTETT